MSSPLVSSMISPACLKVLTRGGVASLRLIPRSAEAWPRDKPASMNVLKASGQPLVVSVLASVEVQGYVGVQLLA